MKHARADNMIFYQCQITMYDYLFYATTERGKVAETGPFVHNYALAYALSKLWSNQEKIPSFFQKKQEPTYKEELSSVNFYITPAKLISGQQKVIQYNTKNEGYHLAKDGNLGYPNWGYIKPFIPGSIFKFYVISEFKLKFPRYIRLGKFMGKAMLDIKQAQKSQSKNKEFTTSLLLNWEDLHNKPEIFDILPGTLPTQLIENGYYPQENFWEVKFGDEKINFPKGMDYLCSR